MVLPARHGITLWAQGRGGQMRRPGLQWRRGRIVVLSPQRDPSLLRQTCLRIARNVLASKNAVRFCRNREFSPALYHKQKTPIRGAFLFVGERGIVVVSP